MRSKSKAPKSLLFPFFSFLYNNGMDRPGLNDLTVFPDAKVLARLLGPAMPAWGAFLAILQGGDPPLAGEWRYYRDSAPPEPLKQGFQNPVVPGKLRAIRVEIRAKPGLRAVEELIAIRLKLKKSARRAPAGAEKNKEERP